VINASPSTETLETYPACPHRFTGDIEFAVNKVNAEEGEFGGVFVSKQPGKHAVTVSACHPIDYIHATSSPSSRLNYLYCIIGDTDMGGKKPKNILSRGIFYGHIEPL
jgi:hypothetical protein